MPLPKILYDKIKNYIYLVRGEDRGRKAWHYIVVDRLKLPIFLNKMKNESSFDIADYGKVIFSGWGNDPPEDIVKKVKSGEFDL